MPGENVFDWSITASDNGNSDSLINWQEGQARASVNNSARSTLAAIAKWRNLTNGSIVTTGAANAQAFSSGMTFTTIPTGMRVMLKVGFTNTDSTTLDMDAIGAVVIKDPLGTELVGGELVVNAHAELVYDGTNWILLYTSLPRVQTIINNITSTTVISTDFIDLPTGTKSLTILATGIKPTTNGTTMLLRLSSDNGATFETTSYSYSIIQATGGVVGHGQSTVGTSFLLASNVSGASTSGQARILIDLPGNGITSYHCHFAGISSAGGMYNNLSGGYRLMNANAFRLLAGTGTMTATLTVYAML